MQLRSVAGGSVQEDLALRCADRKERHEGDESGVRGRQGALEGGGEGRSRDRQCGSAGGDGVRMLGGERADGEHYRRGGARHRAASCHGQKCCSG